MIAWNAFLDYFILTGDQVKINALIILSLGLILPRLNYFKPTLLKPFQFKTGTVLVFILFFAFLVRLGWVLWSPHTAPSAGTEDLYILRHAHNLAEGKGYITAARDVTLTENDPIVYTADRPIGYALWLSILFWIFGERIWIAELFQVLFGTFTVFLVYWVSRQIFNRDTSLIAAGLFALYPTAVFSTKIICEEHLFLPFWLFGIGLLVSDYKNSSWKKVLLAGIIFGIGAHIRTYAFAMGLVVFFVWSVFKRQVRTALIRACFIQFVIFLFALPWAIRNYYKLGEPIMYSTWIGPILYFSNNDVSDVRYPVNAPPEKGGDFEFLYAKNELERNRAGKKAAFRWIAENPALFLQKASGRVIYMLGISREGWVVTDNFNTIKEGRKTPAKRLIREFDKWDSDYYGTVFLFFILSLVLFVTVKRDIEFRQGLWVILTTIAYYLAIVGLTLGHRKYRFPLEPLFCILAAYAFYYLFIGWWMKSNKRT